MDNTQFALLCSAILGAGATVAAAMKWAVGRTVRSVDDNTSETRNFGTALAEQRTELALYAEAARETAAALRQLHTQVVKLNTQLSTAMRMAPETEPPPLPPPPRDIGHETTPVQGIPIALPPQRSGPVAGGAYHQRKPTKGGGG